MRITASYSRKIGTSNYGSIGALVAIEEDFDPEFSENPEEAVRLRREALMVIAKEGVDLQLQQDQDQIAATHHQEPPPEYRQDPAPRSQGQNAYGNHREEAPPRKSYGAPQGNNQSRGGGYQGNAPRGNQGAYSGPQGPPRSGAGLYSWAKGRDEQYGSSLVTFINGWAKDHGLRGPWKDWTPEAVADAYQLAQGELQGD